MSAELFALDDMGDNRETALRVCGKFADRYRSQTPSCGRILPLASFGNNKTGPGGYSAICSTCYHLWGSYRLRFDDCQHIFAAQGEMCAIPHCRTAIRLEGGAGAGGALVDHDHGCSHPDKGTRSCRACVRGILCVRCNAALGFLELDPRLLDDWLAYLRRAQL